MTGKPAELLDSAVIAIEHTQLKGEFALLSSQVSQSLGNVSSQISALQGESRQQMQLLRSVEQGQQSIQAHSSAVERLARSIEQTNAENMQWRRDHESEMSRWREKHERENHSVAERVTKFQGTMIGISLLAGAVFTVGVMWINAEFSNTRREHTADVAQIRQSIAENKQQERGGP